MSRRSLLCVILALTAGVSGCTSTSKPVAPARPALSLVAFDSCAQLTAGLRAAAAENVGPYGFPGEIGAMSVPDVVRGGARTAMEAAPAPAFSGTNVHEPDADEPDIVKTDGRRIVTVAHGTLRVVDAAARRVTGTLALGPDVVGDVQVLLSGDHALVLVSQAYSYSRIGGRVPVDARPQLILVDLTGTPRVISRYRGEGMLIDARQTGSIARVVLRSTPRIAFPDPPRRGIDETGQIAANREAIARAGVDAWLPSWSVTTGGVTEHGTVDCGRVSRPAVFSGASLLSILTFDLNAAQLTSGDPVAVAADADTVYATGTSLYLAADQRWRLDMVRDVPAVPRPVKSETEIYRFATEGAKPPVFAADGKVPGYLVNQYALSEFDGRLRVATTDPAREQSAVRVLEQRGATLTQVGMVDGLGKGERIYSVRFIGPRGYVVTFRNTDPLYSLDLSDPAKPRLAGQLEITGYSAHLQPIGDDRLIGIGQETDGNGQVRGAKVSLFDVSDPAAPRRLAQYQVPGGWSEAEFDPHALLWWSATQLLAVPMLGYGPAQNGDLALRVTGNGLTRIGTLTQPTDNPIRRTLVVGDTLWTVSDTGLAAASMSTMDRLSWLPND
jgi:uncharacterized secreted protein with C-terminal beta-propeller domain